jgi:anthranilate/para-aminobenzoate synthase component I
MAQVKVEELMIVERFSHVMHLVSVLSATLREGLDCFDAFAAVFPAGTVSGAPKVRAMEIIDELEPTRRGAYAGGVSISTTPAILIPASRSARCISKAKCLYPGRRRDCRRL